MSNPAPAWPGNSPLTSLKALWFAIGTAAGAAVAERGVPPRTVSTTISLEADDANAIAAGKDDTRRNMALMFCIRVGSAGILFLSQIVLARWMGAAEYGLYVSLWTAVVVLGGLCHFGLNMAMIRLIPEYQAQGRVEQLRGLLIGGRAFAMLSASIVTVLGTIATNLFVAPHNGELASILTLVLLCLPAYALTDVQDGLGRGQGWAGTGLALPYLVRPVIVLVVATLAFAGGYAGGARIAVIAAVIATWATAVAQTLLIESRLARIVAPGPARFEISTWLRISLPLLAVGSAEIVLQNADVLLLNVFRPAAEVGIYYAAAKTMSLTLFVHYAVGSAFARRIATAGAQNDRDAVRQIASQAVRWTFWPSAALSCCMLLAGPLLLDQFGHGFSDAYPMMFVLAIGMLVRAATGPSEIILNMLGHQAACARSFAIAAGVAIVGNLILIPFAGTMGAAIATSAAFATAALLNWQAARAHLDLNLLIGSQWLTGAFAVAAAETPPTRPLGTLANFDGLEFEIASDLAAIERLAPEWNAFFSAHAASHQVFLSHGWMSAWARHFTTSHPKPQDARPAVVIARLNGRVVLIWPLVIKTRLGLRQLTWAGMPVSQYGDVLAERGPHSDEILAQCWRFVLRTLSPDVVHLRKVRADAKIAAFLGTTGARQSDHQAAPYMDFNGAANYAAYELRYSGKARKNRRRLLRRLEEQGHVTFAHHSPSPEAAAMVETAITMKRAWLADRKLLSPTLDDPRTLAFFQDISATGSDSLVSTISIDGKPCAIMVAVAIGDRLAGHIFTYDLNYEKAGAGALLLEDCLRHACASGYRYYDLLAPADAYKLDWADGSVAVSDWTLARSPQGTIYDRVYLKFLRTRARAVLSAPAFGWIYRARAKLLEPTGRPTTVARA